MSAEGPAARLWNVREVRAILEGADIKSNLAESLAARIVDALAVPAPPAVVGEGRFSEEFCQRLFDALHDHELLTPPCDWAETSGDATDAFRHALSTALEQAARPSRGVAGMSDRIDYIQFEALPWVTVESSNLRRVAYVCAPGPEAEYDSAVYGTLYVEFHGGRSYRYRDVPLRTVDALLEAESVGGFFNTHIKAEYAATALVLT